jgi:hypothetical protein
MKTLRINFTLLCILLLFTQVNFAQAPILGRVATFALFTSAGALSNTGVSVINGDIGTNVGALTGFPHGTVIGSIHVADSVTTLAATNLATAYASLGALTCDSTIGATMGNGQVLTPKVYCITTLASINGTLTLNALGNPNAIFVIKVNGALSTTVASQILLVNSANLSNVYWQVNGAFTLSDSSVFKGTLLANGAISLLPQSALTGRALTTAGAIAIQQTNNMLPVKLLSFTAACNKKVTTFNWVTASEVNNSYFSIEGSTDQHNWTSIAQVVGAGSSNAIKNYSYTNVNQVSLTTYYRLKQTDRNGYYTYSFMVAVNPCEPKMLLVETYPNPTSGFISLTYYQEKTQLGFVALYDLLGNRVFYTEGFPSNINVVGQPSGIYFLHVQNAYHKIVKKIIIECL